MAFFHGSRGRVTVKGVPLKMAKVSYKYLKPSVEVTNSETEALDNGAVPREFLEGGGIHGIEGSVEAYYDLDSTPHGDPPDLTGVSHVAIEIHLTKGGKKIVIPLAHIEDVEANLEVTNTDAVKYSFNFKGSGKFTLPT